MHAKTRPTLYEQLQGLPDGLTGEILSSSTESKDREIKMPTYARYGVAHAWLLDPRTRTLEAYALRQGQWAEVGRFTGSTPARIPPFDAVLVDLGALWDDGEPA
jgi:Uma2 family endonuclease